MCPSFSSEEQAILYGITGGIPEYISRISSKLTLDENIVELFFTESGRLYEEPSNLLKQELRDPSTYNSVIGAIAGGASKMNEIATKAGIETGAASNLLQALIRTGNRPKGSSHYGKGIQPENNLFIGGSDVPFLVSLCESEYQRNCSGHWKYHL